MRARLSLSPRRFLLATAVGGIAAGIASTLVQIALWLLFTDAFPAILWRDTRLTAALALGPRILTPEIPLGWDAWTAATLIHFALSLVYSAGICAAVRSLTGRPALLAGALLGLLLYAVNLHGFTLLFPWFIPARGWITAVAHLAFGMSAAAACRCVTRHA